ncbi:hypothetical protein ABW19_dt0204259 [Dactylella cylindrospora]|nr:hypothetical protein ABW19_dt0204259 [Dactylella cylindrospora]
MLICTSQAMHRYANTTQEARELVAELEFVWDQIKSNHSSSSSSTPYIPTLASTTPMRPSSSLSHQQNISSQGLQLLPPMSPTEEEAAARFRAFPPVGMGVQTDDEEAARDGDNDDDDDDDENYQTMDEFDENGLPRVAVISEPATFKEGGTESHHTQHTQSIAGTAMAESSVKKSKLIKRPASSHLSAQSKKASTSSQPPINPPTQANSGINPHYSRWKMRVEAALTKMTAEVAAMREQLAVSRSIGSNGSGISRGRFGWLRRWIGWGVWLVVKHIVVDAILLIVLIMWMRKRGDHRLEAVLNLLGGFIGDRLRLKKGDSGGGNSRTFVVA